MTRPVLHGYFRSSASWRVRIALNLKGVEYESRSVHLRAGDQRSEAFLAFNPQGLVPVLEMDGHVLTQSLAICDYLDATRPKPLLTPGDAAMQARIRAFAQAIACDIHPVQNLKILKRVVALTGRKEDGPAWARQVIEDGFDALLTLLPGAGGGRFCFGDGPTLADICLVPQLANARRFGVDLGPYGALLRIEEECARLPAFAAAHPDRQPDFEAG